MNTPNYRKVFTEFQYDKLRWHLGRTARIEDESLCDYCGVCEGSELCAIGMISTREEIGVRITHCPSLVPILKFATGLAWMGKNQEWNTLRLGAAWAERVIPGSYVRLEDANDDCIARLAQVISVVKGEKDYMLKRHSKHNHLGMVLNPKGRPKAMEALLKSMYGGGFYKNATQLTAIYIRVLE